MNVCDGNGANGSQCAAASWRSCAESKQNTARDMHVAFPYTSAYLASAPRCVHEPIVTVPFIFASATKPGACQPSVPLQAFTSMHSNNVSHCSPDNPTLFV